MDMAKKCPWQPLLEQVPLPERFPVKVVKRDDGYGKTNKGTSWIRSK